MKFENYTTDDFLMDDSFVAYRSGSDSSAIAFWTEWQLRHPSNLAEFREAERLFDLLSGKKPDMEQSLEELKGLIADREKIRAVDWQSRSKNGRRNWWMLAASILLVSGLSGYWLWQNQSVSYQTDFGQQQVVDLPDGSRVTLNSHSRLTFRRNWSATESRDVNLEGEGFFSVRHLTTNAPFRVLTDGGFRVEVLGTEFTMTNRDQLKRVVLNRGKVRVDGSSDGSTLTLSPGELAQLDRRSGALIRRTVKPEQYDAWRRNQLVFEGATLAEAAWQIEEQFGVDVQLASEVDTGRRFSGILPLNDPEMILTTLATYNGLTVRRHGDTYTLAR
ncbi:FecR family protein [Larkinella sp. VNQ87]|uniref:FecR family protein n=1 Tax=Larkinella sp. VNQ87 TaxID=3400921 RepID=UPI003C100038